MAISTIARPFKAISSAGRARKPLKWAMVAMAGLGLGLAGFAASGQTPPPVPPVRQHVSAQATSPAITTPGGKTLDKTDVDAWLDGFFPYALQKGDVAGAVVVVVKDGQVLTQRGYGYADIKARKPVDAANTLFRVGSVSKLFTWTAVMQMVEQGKLSLDADINQYLDFRIPPYQGKPITLRNIMTHTTGFEESIRKLDESGTVPPALGDLLKRWTPHRIFAPGDVTAYSNYGAALAGYMVERVSGEPFDTYVERHVFAPVGIAHASFRQPLPKALQPMMAQGYDTASTPAKPFEILSLAPAGSLSISGSDMAKFLIAQLADGGPLMKPETARLMHTPQASPMPRIDHMALGFYTQDQNGHRVIAHGGDLRFMHSNVWLFLDDHVGLYVSMNSVGREGAVSPIRNLLVKEFADRYFPGPSPKGQVDPAVARQHAQMMAGWYISSRGAESSFLHALGVLGQQRVVPTKSGGIRLIPDRNVGGGEREWNEIAPFLWKASSSDALLEAHVTDGKVDRFATNAVTVSRPVPWTMSAGWLFLALQIAFGVVALTAIAWPAGAISRRLYKAPLALQGRERLRFHLVRGLSLLAVLVVLGWAYALLVGAPSYVLFNGGMDGLVLLLQVATPLVFLALLLVAGWNLWSAWTARRGWFGRLWAILLVYAAVMAWWGALVFHLIGLGNNY
jgi:CubicO group peptidase (beta-lactamase class C family)